MRARGRESACVRARARERARAQERETRKDISSGSHGTEQSTPALHACILLGSVYILLGIYIYIYLYIAWLCSALLGFASRRQSRRGRTPEDGERGKGKKRTHTHTHTQKVERDQRGHFQWQSWHRASRRDRTAEGAQGWALKALCCWSGPVV